MHRTGTMSRRRYLPLQHNHVGCVRVPGAAARSVSLLPAAADLHEPERCRKCCGGGVGPRGLTSQQKSLRGRDGAVQCVPRCQPAPHPLCVCKIMSPSFILVLQPRSVAVILNLRGILNNAYHTVELQVESMTRIHALIIININVISLLPLRYTAEYSK